MERLTTSGPRNYSGEMSSSQQREASGFVPPQYSSPVCADDQDEVQQQSAQPKPSQVVLSQPADVQVQVTQHSAQPKPSQALPSQSTIVDSTSLVMPDSTLVDLRGPEKRPIDFVLVTLWIHDSTAVVDVSCSLDTMYGPTR